MIVLKDILILDSTASPSVVMESARPGGAEAVISSIREVRWQVTFEWSAEKSLVIAERLVVAEKARAQGTESCSVSGSRSSLLISWALYLPSLRITEIRISWFMRNGGRDKIRTSSQGTPMYPSTTKFVDCR